MFKPKCNLLKLKTNLKVAVKRLQLLEKKHDNSNILARKEVAELLRNKRFEIAKIKVEQLIRDDYYREALEILETYCTLCISRFGLIETVEACDAGIRRAVCTILWATPRVAVDVTEFKEISKQFTLRYGREFKEACMANAGSEVCHRVSSKLTFVMPDEALVVGYLNQIAEKYKVNASFPAPEILSPLDAPVIDPTGVMAPAGFANPPPMPSTNDMLAGLSFPQPVGLNIAAQQQVAPDTMPPQQPQQSYAFPQAQQQQQQQQQQQFNHFPTKQEAAPSDTHQFAFPPSVMGNNNAPVQSSTNYPPQPTQPTQQQPMDMYPPQEPVFPPQPPSYEPTLGGKGKFNPADIPSPFEDDLFPTHGPTAGGSHQSSSYGGHEDTLASLNQLPPPPGSETLDGDESIDFEDLSRRFDALNSTTPRK